MLFAAALGAAADADFCVDDGTWTTVAGSGVGLRLVMRRGLPAEPASGNAARARGRTNSWGDAATTFSVINTNLDSRRSLAARRARPATSAARTSSPRVHRLKLLLYVDNDGTAASGGGTLRLVRGDYDSHAVLATSDAVVWRRDVWRT